MGLWNVTYPMLTITQQGRPREIRPNGENVSRDEDMETLRSGRGRKWYLNKKQQSEFAPLGFKGVGETCVLLTVTAA